MEEEKEVTGKDAAFAGVRIVVYIALIILVVVGGFSAIGAVIAPLVP